MSVFNYIVGSWSDPKMVPKPSKPLKAAMPEIPDGFFEWALEDRKEILDDIFNTIAFNSRAGREHRKEQKAYREAQFDAIQNKMIETKAQAKSYAKSRAEDKKLLSRLMQRALERNKASEKKMIAKMAQSWASKNQKARKTQEKVKREGTKGV